MRNFGAWTKDSTKVRGLLNVENVILVVVTSLNFFIFFIDNHVQWSDAGSGEIVNDLFVQPVSGHAGSVMGWFSMWNGIVTAIRIPPGQTVDGDFYHKILVKWNGIVANKLGVRVANLREKDLVFPNVCK